MEGAEIQKQLIKRLQQLIKTTTQRIQKRQVTNRSELKEHTSTIRRENQAQQLKQKLIHLHVHQIQQRLRLLIKDLLQIQSQLIRQVEVLTRVQIQIEAPILTDRRLHQVEDLDN